MNHQTHSVAVRDHPRVTFEPSVIAEFESRVEENPERTAVKARSKQTSYETLNALANRFGRGMYRRFDGERPIVALLFEHGEEQIAAMLGALKAGLVYVPLDATYPLARLSRIFADAGASLLVASYRNAALAAEIASGLCPVAFPDEFTSLSGENLGRQIFQDELAYIFYTSGSTGEPKGVMQNHRNLLHLAMIYADAISLSHEDQLTFLYSYSFSAGVKDVLAGLVSGATVCPLDVKEAGFGGLATLLAEGITVYHSVPSVFRQLCARIGEPADFPSLRLVSLGSEPVTSIEVGLFRKHFPRDCRLHIEFGATETGVISQYFVNEEEDLSRGMVSVGHAVEGKDISVVDEAGQPVPVGQEGWLAVTSRYLSPGYWRRPDLTQAAFRSDAEDGVRTFRTGDLVHQRTDGCLEFRGRADSRVKIRGYTVDTAEVEVALRELESVREAVVVVRDGKAGGTFLTAYLVPSASPAPIPQALRSAMGERLPQYMVPSRYIMLDAMPMTPNEKVDRRALMERPIESDDDTLQSGQSPQCPVEIVLAGLISEVLQISAVAVETDFLQLGGDSLTAAQFCSRVLDLFGVELPLLSIFESPNVAGLAQALRVASGDPDVLERIAEGWLEGDRQNH